MMDGGQESLAASRGGFEPGSKDRILEAGCDSRSIGVSGGIGHQPHSAAIGVGRQRIAWPGHAGIAVNGIICALVRRSRRRTG